MKPKFKLLLLFVLTCAFSYSQEIKISGLVTSADDTFPLPGVNVIVKGTTTGTITDFDGNYSISAPKGAVLEFSSIGFKSVSMTVGNQAAINVAMQIDVASLDEVVVIGYGAQKKADLTGAISTIKSEDIQKTPNSNVLQSLQGKVAGAQVVSVGSPGDSPTVRLRGVGSFGAAGNPLYVVDGVWYDTIDFLDSNQIESISVLKDVSSLAIFGQKAANGVIIIETKSGKIGQHPQFSYNGYTGVQYAQNVLKMANAEQFVTLAYESGSQPDIDHVNAAIARFGRSRINPNLPDVNTDWYKEIIRPATITSHSIGVNGGGENVNYAVGTSYFSQDGILDMKNEYERFNINANVDVKVSERFKMGVNSVFSNATKYNAENGAWFQAYFAVPILPVYDYQNDQATTIPYSDATILGYRSTQNPFPLLRYNDNQLKVRKLLTSIYAQYYFIPEKLSFKTTYSIDYSTIAERNVRLPYYITERSRRLQTETSITRKDNAFTNQTWNNILNYNDSFGDHHINVILGTDFHDDANNEFKATGQDITGIGLESSWYLNFADPTSFNGQVKEIGDRFYRFSTFGRLEYNFMDRYLINATARREGDSKFPRELYVNTGSVGIGWVISEENFMQDNGIFDFLKLRASWGQLANGNLGGSAGSRTVDIVQTDIGDSPTDGFITSSNFVNLKREILEEKNFGISARLFKNRLSVEADYYIRDTKDLVLPVFQPIVSNTILENVGAIRNKGLEIALD
ncbi:MAG: SusC/RagA family TonB-linked outer membrane protein, partial [Aquaticitalea sp.]